jgi:hypothetical protein
VSCVKLLKRADKEIIKPLLIYNYESGTHKQQQKFFEEFNKHGGIDVEQVFIHNNNERKSAVGTVNMLARSGKALGSEAEALDGPLVNRHSNP